MHTITSSVNNDDFVSSFPVHVFHMPSLHIPALVGAPSTRLYAEVVTVLSYSLYHRESFLCFVLYPYTVFCEYTLSGYESFLLFQVC